MYACILFYMRNEDLTVYFMLFRKEKKKCIVNLVIVSINAITNKTYDISPRKFLEKSE